MFIKMLSNQRSVRYTNTHYLSRLVKILEHCVKTQYSEGEKHHILPKSWFPEYSKEKLNIIRIPSRLHFLIHHLMHKAFPKDKSMYTAFWNMTHFKKSNRITSKQYSALRILHSENLKLNNPAKNGVMDKFKGDNNPTKRLEVREKISKAKKGHIVSNEQREKQRKTMERRNSKEENPFFGKKHSEETIAIIRQKAALRSKEHYRKIAEKNSSKPKLECPHCNKMVDDRNAKRWHFDKCKLKHQ